MCDCDSAHGGEDLRMVGAVGLRVVFGPQTQAGEASNASFVAN